MRRIVNALGKVNWAKRAYAIFALRAATAAMALVVLATGSAQAQIYTFSVLYSFTGSPDGLGPVGALVRDAQGNLYGETYLGGAYGWGTVFEVDATGKETVLYSFTGTGGDGVNPTAGLVRDAQGNLYGTTLFGGDPAYRDDVYCDGYPYGCGTVFEVDTTGKETVLHSFTGRDGSEPDQAGLVRDAQGNLYGTTRQGGAYPWGVVFKLDATGKETVLYSFTLTGDDGAYPYCTLVRDAQGNLYGTTGNGGAYGYGTVFEVDATGKETVLYSFCSQSACTDGVFPVAGLVQDAQGNLYGTTIQGGATNAGTVFEVDATGKETVLYSFTGTGGDGDGAYPQSTLVRDAQGNLYGTTSGGGGYECLYGCGTVFKLDATGKETVLHSFTGTGGDGTYPFNVVLDAQGNLYGISGGGGAYNYGTVFKINAVPLLPSQVATTTSGLAYSRVTQTFNGTVTIQNISGSPINGPFQMFFMGVTAGVTLANATGSLYGSPYLTVPGVASLVPGQKATVKVQFKDPSNAPINFTPAIYPGSLN